MGSATLEAKLQDIVSAAVADTDAPALTFGTLFRDKEGKFQQVWASAGELPLADGTKVQFLTLLCLTC